MKSKSAQQKKIVITGGPCSGKTTLINELERRGYCTVPEVAREIMDEQLAQGGDLLPWNDLYDFEKEFTRRQLDYEDALRVNGDPVYFDRSLVDPLAYCKLGNIYVPKTLSKANSRKRYGKVFLLDPLPVYENDDVRKEDEETSKMIYGLLNESYRELGYEVIRVPVFPGEEGFKRRADFIEARSRR